MMKTVSIERELTREVANRPSNVMWQAASGDL